MLHRRRCRAKRIAAQCLCEAAALRLRAQPLRVLRQRGGCSRQITAAVRAAAQISARSTQCAQEKRPAQQPPAACDMRATGSDASSLYARVSSRDNDALSAQERHVECHRGLPPLLARGRPMREESRRYMRAYRSLFARSSHMRVMRSTDALRVPALRHHPCHVAYASLLLYTRYCHALHARPPTSR